MSTRQGAKTAKKPATKAPTRPKGKITVQPFGEFGGLACKVIRQAPREKSFPKARRAESLINLIGEELLSYDREHLLCVLLNKNLQVIGIDTVAVGILDMVGTTAREVFKSAIITSAHAVILVHNRPTELDNPSVRETGFAQDMKDKGKWLGIRVIDHIILGSGGKYFSFHDNAVFRHYSYYPNLGVRQQPFCGDKELTEQTKYHPDLSFGDSRQLLEPSANRMKICAL